MMENRPAARRIMAVSTMEPGLAICFMQTAKCVVCPPAV